MATTTGKNFKQIIIYICVYICIFFHRNTIYGAAQSEVWQSDHSKVKDIIALLQSKHQTFANFT